MFRNNEKNECEGNTKYNAKLQQEEFFQSKKGKRFQKSDQIKDLPEHPKT